MLPCLEGTEGAVVGQVVLEEFAKQPLMGTAGVSFQVRGFSARGPDREAVELGGRDGAPTGRLPRAVRAEDAAGGGGELQVRGVRFGGVTSGTALE